MGFIFIHSGAVMSDKTTEIFEHLRYNLITKDRRFSEVNGKLCFEGVNVEELAKKYGSPVYVYSERLCSE